MTINKLKHHLNQIDGSTNGHMEVKQIIIDCFKDLSENNNKLNNEVLKYSNEKMKIIAEIINRSYNKLNAIANVDSIEIIFSIHNKEESVLIKCGFNESYVEVLERFKTILLSYYM